MSRIATRRRSTPLRKRTVVSVSIADSEVRVLAKAARRAELPFTTYLRHAALQQADRDLAEPLADMKPSKLTA